MANVNTKAHVLVRDGFACRLCGALLLLPQAIKLLDRQVPGLDLYDAHGKTEPLRSRWATVDHVIPEIQGGMDTLDNLVACCVVCNSRKGGTVGPRREAQTRAIAWDGLSSLFLELASTHARHLSGEDKRWRDALGREGIEASLAHLQAAVDILQTLKRDPGMDLDARLSFLARSMPEGA
ncbi:MAG: HNH endonuclease [Candidatus Sumerlaeia bacterium]|nr:HNH endonuclease [Candidatus Sumerlaeia bacterium]